MLYPPHEYALLLPRMSPAAIMEMAANMKAHGVMHPITLYQGRVLDGVNRQEAARLAGVDCPTIEFEGTDEQALALVIRENAHQRHMNTGQRAAVALTLANVKFGDNQHTAAELPTLPRITQTQAADMMNVSERSMRTLQKLMDEAPELAQDVRSGTTKLHAAAAENDKRRQAALNDEAKRNRAAAPPAPASGPHGASTTAPAPAPVAATSGPRTPPASQVTEAANAPAEPPPPRVSLLDDMTPGRFKVISERGFGQWVAIEELSPEGLIEHIIKEAVAFALESFHIEQAEANGNEEDESDCKQLAAYHKERANALEDQLKRRINRIEPDESALVKREQAIAKRERELEDLEREWFDNEEERNMDYNPMRFDQTPYSKDRAKRKVERALEEIEKQKVIIGMFLKQAKDAKEFKEVCDEVEIGESYYNLSEKAGRAYIVNYEEWMKEENEA